MTEDIFIMIIKNFFINIFTYLTFFKVYKNTKVEHIEVKIIIASVMSTILYVTLDQKVAHIFIVFLIYILQIFCLKILTKNENLLTANLVANAIVYIMFTLSGVIEMFIKYFFNIQNHIIDIALIIIIESIAFILFFKIKRFSKGFTFIRDKVNNSYLDIIMVNICVVVIFAYCLFGESDKDTVKQMLIPFCMLSIIMFIMIQKTLTLYYKQKLLARTIDDYKVEIEQKDKKIEELSEEKFKISKLNHEFYNRQKALEQKVNEFIKNKNLNMETAEELSPIKQIQNLSDEYSEKLENIKHLEKLSLTEIEEIDDMFKYMQAECKKNNIDFKLQVNGNIHHLINKLIPQDRLVTLIGDHIRDAIIAVNSSNNKFRSIVTFIGIKDNYYEFSVYDTGIEFEIETLVNLGTKPITTHKDTGGTGIGFITTFETLKETKASLIIEEKHKEMDNDYTKAVNIKFDGKGEYRINSYRANEIKEKDKKGRIIIEK